MRDIIHVFVSSTWHDLQPERKAVETELQRMQETKLIGMEYFSSRSDTTRNVSIDEVDRSHYYIGIFAERYGSGITVDEYRRAQEKHIPCHIYFKEEATITPEQRETDPDKVRKLTTLKNELHDASAGHLVTRFTSPDNLSAMVTADLHLYRARLFGRPAIAGRQGAWENGRSMRRCPHLLVSQPPCFPTRGSRPNTTSQRLGG